MHKKFYPIKPFLIFLLLQMGVKTVVHAQASLTVTRTNVTTGNADNPGVNNIMKFTITAKNTGSTTLTNTKLYNPIPSGTSYVPGTTRVNNVPVPDASGKMRFSNVAGTLISTGSFAPNVSVTIDFNVQITATAGIVADYATVRGTQGVNNIVQNAKGADSRIDGGAKAGIIYQSTGATSTTSHYSILRDQAGVLLYDGNIGPCFDALTGASLQRGSLLSQTRAIAADVAGERVYFVNSYHFSPNDLSFVNFIPAGNHVQTFPGFNLEPATTDNGWLVTRMTSASDGNFYALTDNGQDLSRFNITSSGVPSIFNLGPLVNDPTNGTNDVLAETGGDMFGGSEGKIYLVTGSGKLYRINPTTLVALYLGTISNLPASGIQSAAMDNNGTLFVGGKFDPATGIPPTSVFTVNLATMTATPAASGGYESSDYTSVNIPVLAHSITANQSYRNTTGRIVVVAGDPIEYTIEVANTGNIGATAVKVSDPIPAFATYVPNSTTVNGVPVADVNGTMPFSVTGGQYINSTGARTGMVQPGNNVVIKFQVITEANKSVCNQPLVIYPGIDGSTVNLTPNTPVQNGIEESNCFFSSGIICGCTPTFTGTLSDNQPLLQWSVEKEDNIDHYEVEYAAGNSSQFNAVARVSTGTSKYPQHRLVDKSNPLTSLSNYRLKVVQKNGTISYSDTVQLSGMGAVQVRPNPFREDLNLQVQLKTAQRVQIRLIDLNGRTVFATTQQLSAGVSSLQLDIPARVTTGVYVLEVLAGNNRLLQKKLVKQ